MMTTLKQEFVRRIDIDSTYTLNDLKKILGEVYKEVAAAQKEEGKKKREKRERDENGEIIKKRPASAYNLFIKEQSAIIKAANPTFDSKTVFKMAIDEWKKQKGQDNKVEEEPSVSSPKPTPEPESKSTTSVHNPEPEPEQAPEPVNKDTENTVNIDNEEKKTKKARKPKKTTQDDE